MKRPVRVSRLRLRLLLPLGGEGRDEGVGRRRERHSPFTQGQEILAEFARVA